MRESLDKLFFIHLKQEPVAKCFAGGWGTMAKRKDGAYKIRKVAGHRVLLTAQ